MPTEPRQFDDAKRHAVYLRDSVPEGYKCAYSGYVDKTCTGKRLSLDHLDPIHGASGELQNKRHEPATNLTTAHGPTNFAKADKTREQWSDYAKNIAPPKAGLKFDWKEIEDKSKEPLDLKRGAQLSKLAKQARGARRLDSNGKRTIETPKSKAIAAKSLAIVSSYHSEKQGGGGDDKSGGPGVRHDPKDGKFMPGNGGGIVMQRPVRAKFHADTSRAALAMDPGGSGIISAVMRGQQPQPGAFGFFDVPPPCQFNHEAVEDGVGILALTGPLEHHESWIWQSYERLTREIRAALEAPDVKALALKIDSPGGVAAGMGECHKSIRRMRKEYGKPIYAYADQMACSAAYNVASACDEVWTSVEGVIGSVGVILCTVDETAAMKKAGVKIRYVVTGTRKADLHPGQPVTDDVLDVAQAKVDYLGGLFFGAVAKARGVSAKHVEGLQAAVFHGPDAVKVGLADGVAGWPKFLRTVKASVASGRAQSPQATADDVRRAVASMGR